MFPKTGKGERKWDLLRWVATAAADHGLAPGGGWKAGRGGAGRFRDDGVSSSPDGSSGSASTNYSRTLRSGEEY